MNYYDRKAIEQERLKIVDMREHYEKKGFGQKEILDFIEEQVKQTNAKRLCIDSITAIAYHLNDKSQIRTFIFELGTVLATLGCTTILTNEVADTGKFSMYDVEEFISDAINLIKTTMSPKEEINEKNSSDHSNSNEFYDIRM